MVEIFCDGEHCCWCRLDVELVPFDGVLCSACKADRCRQAVRVERQKVHTPGAGVRPSLSEAPPALIAGGIAELALAVQAAGWNKPETEAGLAASREFWSGVKRDGALAGR